MTRLLCVGLLLVGLGSTTSAFAEDAVYTRLFSNDAIGGYDAVAYFTEGRPVEGLDRFSLEYKGAEWKFASQENLDLFQANPEAYAPQYGGYCAWAMSQDYTASAQPDLWTIHDGKLYLNYSEEVNERWKVNMLEFIELADGNWAVLEPELDEG